MSVRYWFRFTPLLLLSCIAGCGDGLHSVTGHVTYEDGSPLDEGSVVAESVGQEKLIMAQANIRKDGSFEWGTTRSGDGAPAGNYRVIVVPRGLGDFDQSQGMLPAVDKKFTSYETSGITFEVKPGRNTLEIKVTRPKKK